VTGSVPAPGGDAGGAEGDHRLLAAALALGALVIGIVAGGLVAGGKVVAVPALAALALPPLLWLRPHVAPAMLLGAAVAIEQFPYTVGPRDGVPTSHIPLFHGLGAVHLNGVDLLLGLVVLLWLVKNAPTAPFPWPRSRMAGAVVSVMAVVLVGVVVGVAHHGDVRTAFTEIRPFFYLGVTYLLASVLLTTRAALRSMLWVLVLGSGVKAGLGLMLFFSVRHLQPRPEAVLGHEEAFFFGIFVIAVLGLWIFQVYGPLRTTATLLLPVVVLADLVNSRRLAFLILGVGIPVMLVIGMVRLPHRRRRIWQILGGLAAVTAVYMPMYWNKTGGLAQPARAVRATVAPSQRDALSNLYRDQENANLRLNIAQAPVLGKGFGVPIDYVLPITDISDIDPLITHIPHNGVLYIFMRMGIPGGVAFWSLIGVGMITGCRLAKARDTELAFLGALLVCGLLAYTLQGYNDQGFFFYRIALAVGLMLGMAEAALRYDRQSEDTTSLPVDGSRGATRSRGRSGRGTVVLVRA
jgi:hypothetical protein